MRFGGWLLDGYLIRCIRMYEVVVELREKKREIVKWRFFSCNYKMGRIGVICS